MAVRFSDEQVVKATGGRRVHPGRQVSYPAVCTDTRQLTPGCLFVALCGEKFDAHDFLHKAVEGGAAGALVKKGHALPSLPPEFALFEVDDTLRGLGALARFHRFRFKIPVGAVTGSNGKTTTKEMVGAILETRGPALKTAGNLNNEVGVPLTLFGLGPLQVAAVVEMGMSNPGEIARLTELVRPDAGLITVVQPAHLHGLGSLDGVAAAKGELFKGLPPGATAVVNLDDPRVTAQAVQSKAKMLSFGRSSKAQVQLKKVEPLGREGLELTIAFLGEEHRVRLSFVGEHNALNAAGAFAMGVALGYRPDECVAGLTRARPHARRLNVVDAPGGFVVLDDCYNANPSSMAAALETAATLARAGGGRAVAVLGDMLELGPDEAAEHRALGEKAGRAVALAAFFGPASAAGREAAGLLEASAHFTEVEPLVAWLRPRLLPKDVVLVKGSRGMRLERVVEALTGAPSGGEH
ncbi:MAG: UDP-N-acetylmuramoyl-tripeptide--D-alanyl-D-alanine ligase [Myxococcaceae bacterium]